MSEVKVFDRRVFYPGQRIFSEGDKGYCMYFVEKGRVIIGRGNESNQTKIGEITSGGIFGEMALIDGAPRMAHATAAEESVLHAIPQPVFQKKLQEADPFVRALVRVLLTNLRASDPKPAAAKAA